MPPHDTPHDQPPPPPAAFNPDVPLDARPFVVVPVNRSSAEDDAPPDAPPDAPRRVPIRTPETPESRTHAALVALRARIQAGAYASDRVSERDLRAGFLAYLVEHGRIGS